MKKAVKCKGAALLYFAAFSVYVRGCATANRADAQDAAVNKSLKPTGGTVSTYVSLVFSVF